MRKIEAHKIHFGNQLKKGTHSNELHILKSQGPRKENSGLSHMAKCGADLTSKKPYTSINTTLSIYPNTLISVENELK